MTSRRAKMTSSSGSSEKLSEMRITLLGHVLSGKSSSGNTILGSASEQFSLERTAQCEKRQGDVAGRHLTVVETPGWFIDTSLNKTSELIKQEIVRSVSLCPPGPHALLLGIRAEWSYEADWYKKMEEHMQFLSESVWDHTMILFSHGDCPWALSIEQFIESEGKALQSLMEKCGNRYHVFNNENRGDDTQVTQLLEKIEQMVAGEKGGCFKIDRRVLEETEKKRRTQDEGATQRQMKVKKQRESIRSKMGDDLQLSEMRIILLGCEASEKRISGNTILGSESEQFIEEETAQCEKRQGDVAGRHLTVVDTPGQSVTHSLTHKAMIKQEIIHSVSLCPPGPDALLLVIAVNVPHRTADVCKSIEEHMQLLSESVWDHTMILFSCGDRLGGRSIEQYIESEGEALQNLVDKCGNRYHVFNNENRGDDTQVTQLLEKIEEMVAGNGRYGTGSPAAPTPAKSSLSLDVTEKKLTQDQQVEKLTVQMKGMKNELEKVFQRQTEADRRHTSDTQKNTTDIEDSKRRQHQVDQEHPVLVSQVKMLAARFEQSQSAVEKIHQRQTHADKKLTSLSLDVTSLSLDVTQKEQQQQRVNQQQQEQINQLQSDVQKLVQTHSASASQQPPTQIIPEAEKKLLSARRKFIQSISGPTLNELLDELLDKGVISLGELTTAMAEKVTQDKARYIIDIVQPKGNKASSIMIVTIQQLDRNLSEKLQLDPARTGTPRDN